MQVPFGLSIALFALFAAVLAFLSVRNSRAFLFASGFAICLYVPGFAYGVNLFLPYIVGPIGLVGYVFRDRPPANKDYRKILSPFLFYSIGLTLVWMTFEYLDLKRYQIPEALGAGVAQAYLKMPAQLVMFLAVASVFYLLPLHAKSPGEVNAGVAGLVSGCIVSAGVGALMLATVGTGYFAAGAEQGVEIGLMHLPRIGGISGEPKHLGALIVQALAVILPAAIDRGFITSRRLWAAASICVIALFFTFSTSAWYGFFLVLVFSILRSRRRLPRKIVTIFVVAAAAIVASEVPVMTDAVQSRIVARTIDSDTTEIGRSRDTSTLSLLGEKPALFIPGFGLGGADLELHEFILGMPEYASLVKSGGTPTPSAMGLRLLGDVGMIGLALLLIAVIRVDRMVGAGSGLLGRSALVSFMGLLASSAPALPAFFFVVGGILALARCQPKKVRERNAPVPVGTLDTMAATHGERQSTAQLRPKREGARQPAVALQLSENRRSGGRRL